jgi:hypothetical protein
MARQIESGNRMALIPDEYPSELVD